MSISFRVLACLPALAAAGFALAGCLERHTLLIRGDADSAEIDYTGDLASAALIARAHCAQYERVARFSETDEGVAFFKCLRAGAAARTP